MADFENKLHRLGRRIQEAPQQYVRQNIDIPVQQRLDQLRAPTSPEVMGNMRPAQAQSDMDTAKLNAAMAVADNMQRLREREALMKAQMDTEDAARAKSESEFDPESYKMYAPKAEQQTPGRFNTLKSSMMGEQGALSPQDIRQFQPEPQGMIELSEDPEEQARQIAAARLGR